jgi:hypothetical protein
VIPVKQSNRHDPDNGVWGDCHRAAVASILRLPLEAVPHFCDGGPDADEFVRRERNFLTSVGLFAVEFAWAADLDEVLATMGERYDGIHYLLGGWSRTGCNHTVVCCGRRIVHDPSLDDSGIIGPMEPTGRYHVTMFGAMWPCSVAAKSERVKQWYESRIKELMHR